jgi:hypothetical protein
MAAEKPPDRHSLGLGCLGITSTVTSEVSYRGMNRSSQPYRDSGSKLWVIVDREANRCGEGSGRQDQ